MRASFFGYFTNGRLRILQLQLIIIPFQNLDNRFYSADVDADGLPLIKDDAMASLCNMWAILRGSPRESGLLIFTRYFEAQPQELPRFFFVKDYYGNISPKYMEGKAMHDHCLKFMSAMDEGKNRQREKHRYTHTDQHTEKHTHTIAHTNTGRRAHTRARSQRQAPAKRRKHADAHTHSRD